MKNNTVFALLAGGKSERMGVPKGLLPNQNSFWILEQIERIAKSSTSPQIFIGLGYYSEEYLTQIPWLQDGLSDFVSYNETQIRVLINPNPELGSFATLQTILQQIPESKSVLINPIDVPLLNTSELQKIIKTQNQIVLPNYKGKNGHPIKLHPHFWKSLLLLDPSDENSRLDLEIKKVDASKITHVTIDDSCIVTNLNTPKDWLDFTQNK